MVDPTSSHWLDALHLASASLPIGGFAYSQGLEHACETGVVHDLNSAQRWIGDYMQLVVARQELPWWIAIWDACQAREVSAIEEAASSLHALRETAEFRLESRQMAHALLRLYPQWLPQNTIDDPLLHSTLEVLGNDYSAAHAALCAWRDLPKAIGLSAWLWSWLDTQVLAAVKLVPLGQVDGQRLMHALKPLIHGSIRLAIATEVSKAGSAAFGLVIASALHETQYTRLFRS